MKKHLFLHWSICLFVTIFSACGPAGDLNSVDQTGQVAISFAVVQPLHPYYQSLIDEFHQENPLITVRLVAISEEAVGDPSALASLADSSILYGTNLSNPYFLNLQPFVDSAEGYREDDFWPDTLSACRDQNGNQLGIPVQIGVNGIYYAQAALSDRDYPFPEVGWTMEEMRHLLEEISQSAEVDSAPVIADAGGSLILAQVEQHLMRQAGVINPHLLQEEIAWYLDLVRTNRINLHYSSQSETPELQNNQPLIRSGGLNESFADKYIFVPYPVFSETPQLKTTPAWVNCAWISTGSQNPQAAWTWIDFLSHHLLTESAEKGALVLPPARSSLTENEYWETLPSGYESTLRFALDHAFYAQPDSDKAAVSFALQEYAAGGTDFAAAFEAAQMELESFTSEVFPDSTAEIVIFPQPEEEQPGPGTILYYANVFHPAGVMMMDAAVEAFNDSQSAVTVSWSNQVLQTETQTHFSGLSENYDCFTTLSPDWASDYSEQLLDLEPFLDADTEGFLEDFFPAQVALFQDQGMTIGLPAAGEVGLLAYNIDLLQELGLPLPQNNWTFESFIDLASAVSSTTAGEIRYGFAGYGGDWLLLNGKGINRSDLISDPLSVNFDTPQLNAYLQWLKAQQNTNMFLPVVDGDYQAVKEKIISGQVAFWQTQAGTEKYSFAWEVNPEIDFEVGVIPLPKTSAGSWIDPSTIYGHYISKTSRNTQGCWTWFKYLTVHPGAFAGVPTRSSVLESPAWEEIVGEKTAEVYRQALSQSNSVQAEMQTLEDYRILTSFGGFLDRAVNTVLKGGDPGQVLTETQYKADLYAACIQTNDFLNLSDEEIEEMITLCFQQVW